MPDPPNSQRPTTPGDEDAPTSARWEERRIDERAAITLKVDYKRLNTFFADYTKNISKGGTFIRTNKPLEVGTEFLFVLTVPSASEALTLNGEVKWVIAEEEASEERPAGMGIKFKFADVKEREKVEGYVGKLMDEALGSHISQKLLARKPEET